MEICQKQPKAQHLHPKTLPVQIFQHSQRAKNSKRSKPTSQNVAFPNLPTFETCQQQQKLTTYIPKRCLSKASNMRNMAKKIAKAQNLHPKTLPFQTFQQSKQAKNGKKLKTYIPKRCLSKSANIRNRPKTAKAQNLHPRTLPFQIFQHSQRAKNSKSSKPTSQNVAFPNLPTLETCQKQQKLKTYIPKRCFSKSSNIRNMPKTAKAQNLHPKTLPFQIFQHSQRAKQQKLKTYIPKRCVSKSSNIRAVPETAKAQNLHPKTLPF